MRAFSAMLTASVALLLSCAALTPARLPDSPGTLRLFRPEAARVQVVGDWNDWGGTLIPGGILDPSSGRMERGREGWWTVSPQLDRGRYRYAFVIDGSVWITDPSNPETASFGDRTVSVLVIDG